MRLSRRLQTCHRRRLGWMQAWDLDRWQLLFIKTMFALFTSSVPQWNVHVQGWYVLCWWSLREVHLVWKARRGELPFYVQVQRPCCPHDCCHFSRRTTVPRKPEEHVFLFSVLHERFHACCPAADSCSHHSCRPACCSEQYSRYSHFKLSRLIEYIPDAARQAPILCRHCAQCAIPPVVPRGSSSTTSPQAIVNQSSVKWGESSPSSPCVWILQWNPYHTRDSEVIEEHARRPQPHLTRNLFCLSQCKVFSRSSGSMSPWKALVIGVCTYVHSCIASCSCFP